MKTVCVFQAHVFVYSFVFKSCDCVHLCVRAYVHVPTSVCNLFEVALPGAAGIICDFFGMGEFIVDISLLTA